MKKLYAALVAVATLLSLTSFAQTTVFSDDFSTNTNTAFTTNGPIGGSAWSVTVSGADWGARRNTTGVLELTNDASATTNAAGSVLASVATTSFTSPYSSTLNANTGTVTWNFNIRSPRTDPAGLASGSYGAAFILAGTANTSRTTGTGYAITYGQSGATDPVRLIAYSSGLGTSTDVIVSNTSGLTDFGTEYLSIRVIYTPSTNTWELLLRNDGATAFADPAAGTLTSQGTAVNNAYTGTSLPLLGAFWNGSTAANQIASFDNVSVIVGGTAAPDLTPPTITTLSPANGATGVSVNSTATITFSEAIQKLTGNILVKRSSDNVVVQTVDVATAAVSVSGSSASFALSGLAPNTAYYIEVPAASFEDLAGNDFAGFSGNSTWSFTTSAFIGNLLSANFNICTTGSPGSVTDGFTRYSVTGAQVWDCTTFGNNTSNGMQINGFANGTNVTNEDWLISPALNLTSTTYPLLSFWSRTRFNGAPLQLKVSTNYSGSGDPRLATWTDLNGKFPAQTSDVWTLSNNINLSAYKQASVYIAFVYNSTDEEGARWTLDDVSIDNSSAPPPPSLTTSTADVQFSFVANGSSSTRSFVVNGNDITTDITLTVSGSAFTISSDNVNFSNTVTFLAANANNIPQTVYVRFAPTQAGINYNGSISISSSSLNTIVSLKGSSLDPANTLEVVNWNIEWFGSTGNGPTNETQQEQNVVTLMQNANADVYALSEIVSETRLAAVVSQLPGYSYVISNYGSHTNTSANPPSALADAQKLAFVYRTSLLSNVTTTALLSQGINSSADLTNPAYNYFASGRFPYMMSADVTLNGVTKNMKFILLHAKANTSPTATSYDRRKKGSDTLYYTLQQNYANDNIIILGDFNDDLDQTITDGITPPTTSYVAFTSDATNFFAPTLALSQAGKKSTVSYNDVIDHVVVSNEARSLYIAGSAAILTDLAATIPSYGSTTSDHYPVFTRYDFSVSQIPTPLTLLQFGAQKQGRNALLNWSTTDEVNTKDFIIERSADGRNFTNAATIAAAGNSNSVRNYQYTDLAPAGTVQYYRLRMNDLDGKFTHSRTVRLEFNRSYSVWVSPNPAQSSFVVSTNANAPVQMELVNSSGVVVKRQLLNGNLTNVNIASLASGLYIVRFVYQNEATTQKLIKE
jgi:hypothetical protein